VDVMAQHIIDLLEDDELRERVVKQAEQDMAAATWDAAAEKVVAVYKELVARPPRPPGAADRLSLFRD